MIYQNDKNENTQNQFSNALKELKIGNYYETPTLQNPVAFLHMSISIFIAACIPGTKSLSFSELQT